MEKIERLRLKKINLEWFLEEAKNVKIVKKETANSKDYKEDF